MDDLVNNLDCCNKCGLGGRLVCCDSCPKSFHKYCLTEKQRIKISKNSHWSCKNCVSGIEVFSLNEVDIQSSLKVVGAITPIDTATNLSIGQLVLTLEWRVLNFPVDVIAKIMSLFFANSKSTNLETTEYRNLIASIRNAIGVEQFDSIVQGLLVREDSVSTALAPSLNFMSKGCFNCGKIQYFHTLCHMCGYVHNVRENIFKNRILF